MQFRAAINSRIQLRVTGENKPGRMRAAVKDFTVPLAGIPITIGRTYDSLERARVGDFGYGWDLSIGGPKLEVNSQSDVSFTVGGRRMTFFMTPGSSGFPFPFWLTPGYTAERGTYGTLATVGGCPVVIQGANGRYLCFPETVTSYAPTSYVYTAPDGVKVID